MMEPSHPAPAQRAADADREAVAEVLRGAGADGRLSFEELEERLGAVYAARTHPELDVLLADLGGRAGLAAGPRLGIPSPAAGPAPQAGPDVTRTVTIMGENRRQGHWRPAAASRVLTLMGETRLDLGEADLSRPVTHLRVFTVMGETKLELPDDVNVHITKLTIMGENHVDSPPAPPRPGAPELHLRLISIMGSNRVRFRRRRERHTELYA
jgi:hypothetical protein